MESGNTSPEWIDAGVFRRPYSARERLCIFEQAKYDRRNFPAVWLWKLLLLDEVNGVAPDDVLWESVRVRRSYSDPTPAHIYVDWKNLTKKAGKGGVSTQGTVKVTISRAEARRLGKVFETHDDAESLICDGEGDYLYLPRPGDLLRFADDHYIVLQWSPPKRYGPTAIPMFWEGTVSLAEEDVASPGFNLPTPPYPQPPAAIAPRFAWRG
jgi:hypothetical protein